jgi:hypothetical protein
MKKHIFNELVFSSDQRVSIFRITVVAFGIPCTGPKIQEILFGVLVLRYLSGISIIKDARKVQ